MKVYITGDSELSRKKLAKETDSQSKDYTEEEILEAGIEELRDMGIEPHEYDIIEGDEITITKRKPKKINSSDESEEYD